MVVLYSLVAPGTDPYLNGIMGSLMSTESGNGSLLSTARRTKVQGFSDVSFPNLIKLSPSYKHVSPTLQQSDKPRSSVLAAYQKTDLSESPPC